MGTVGHRSSRGQKSGSVEPSSGDEGVGGRRILRYMVAKPLIKTRRKGLGSQITSSRASFPTSIRLFQQAATFLAVPFEELVTVKAAFPSCLVRLFASLLSLEGLFFCS